MPAFDGGKRGRGYRAWCTGDEEGTCRGLEELVRGGNAGGKKEKDEQERHGDGVPRKIRHWRGRQSRDAVERKSSALVKGRER